MTAEGAPVFHVGAEGPAVRLDPRFFALRIAVHPGASGFVANDAELDARLSEGA